MCAKNVPHGVLIKSGALYVWTRYQFSDTFDKIKWYIDIHTSKFNIFREVCLSFHASPCPTRLKTTTSLNLQALRPWPQGSNVHFGSPSDPWVYEVRQSWTTLVKIHFSVPSSLHCQSQAVMCVSTSSMYPESSQILVYTIFNLVSFSF